MDKYNCSLNQQTHVGREDRKNAYYQRKLERIRKYNEQHKEELKMKARERYAKLKADPDKHKAYLQSLKQNYKIKNPKNVLPHKEFE